jgi:serine/threonine protein kinase/Tol biopolymer transport system component
LAVPAGARLGPYEIVGAVGAGGMGEVYRARDTRLDRTVAIKILPEPFARDADRLRRFEREPRVLSGLNHPNLLVIYDVGTQGELHYLVSEFLEGQTLRERMRSGPLPQRKVVDYALQMAHGLAAAHEKGIVHRDLKPENVFITRGERVKIVDFGLAKQILSATSEADGATLASANPTMTGVVLGTAGYMAPEQVRGQGTDHRADIFSFGAILYEAVAGERAFKGESSVETMNAIIHAEPHDLTETGLNVSPGLERIIRRCLEKSPEQRFQSASDLAFALETMTSSTNAIVVPRRAERSRYGWALLAIVLALTLGLLVRSWFARGQPTQVRFSPVSFRPGTIYSARFAPDGQTILYTAALEGGMPDLYSVRRDYPDSQPVGLPGAKLLAISSQRQMALLAKASSLGHLTWEGTLAIAPLGGAPREVVEHVTSADWSPDGSKLAIIRHANGKYRLEYPIGKLRYETPNWIDEVRISPDGARVAFLQHPPSLDNRGDVLVLEPSGALRTLSSGWEGEDGLAWASSGKEVWFSATREGQDLSIHAATLDGRERQITSQPGAVRILDVSAAGEVLLSRYENRSRIDLFPQGMPPKDISWLNYSWGPILSRDGSLIALTDQSTFGGNAYSVYIRKIDSAGPAVRLGAGFAADISSDNKWVIASEPNGGVAMLPIGPGESRTLHWDGINVSRAAFFPDSRKILLMAAHGSGNRLYLTDIDGSTPRPLTGDFPFYYFVPISPDGRSFAYRDHGQWMLQSIDGGAKPLPGVAADEDVVRWGSDGKTVFVIGEGDKELTLYRVAVDSGRRELLQKLRPTAQVGLVSMRNVYFACDMDANGRTIGLSYETNVGTLYMANGMK